jgi:ribonuclease P protein component
LVFKLNKGSSLKSSAEIEQVLALGKKVSNKYLSIYFLASRNLSKSVKKVAVIVGKKAHAQANARNKIKRLMRECLRKSDELEKFSSGNVIINYHSKDVPNLSLLQKNIKTLFLSLYKKVSS